MGGRRRTSGDGESRDNLLTCQKCTTFLNVLDITPCERSVDAMDGGRPVEGLDDTADGRN